MINTNGRRIVPWPCPVRQESLARMKAGVRFMGFLFFAFCMVGDLVCRRCAFASTFYVAVTGDDRHPGTSDKPVRTIGRGAELAHAGDTVVVGPGRYHERIVVRNSGAPDEPITFRASGNGETVVSAAYSLISFTKTAHMRNVHETDVSGAYPGGSAVECYGLIDEGSLHAYTMVPSREACDLIPASFYLDRKARRVFVHTADSRPPAEHKLELSTKSDTFYVSPVVSNKPVMSDIVIEGFTIKHTWRQRAGAVVFGHGAQRAILRKCRIENCWRGSLVSQGSEDCVVEACEVVNCVDGIRFAYLNRGRVANNRVVRRGDHWPYQPSKPSVGIYFYTFDYEKSDIEIEENYIEGYGNGIRLKVGPAASLRNNTIADCETGVLAYTGQRREFVNNLLLNCDVPMIFTNQQPPDGFLCDYNCVADLRAPGRAEKWLGDWQKRTGQAAHSVSKAPMILGAWPDPMSLSRNSPCAGAGQDGSNIGAFPVAAVDRSSEDERPPVGRISCGGQDVGGAEALIRDANVRIQISGSDGEGPVARMRFSNDGKNWSASIPFAAGHDWAPEASDGRKTIYAQFQDKAGNWSAPATTEVWHVARASSSESDSAAPGSRGGRRFFVSTQGSDDGPGTSDRPGLTLAKAAKSALPGDSIVVREGIYYEPLVPSRSGRSKQQRITYRTNGHVIIERGQKWPHGILLEDLKFVTIEGFECAGYTRAGIHVENCSDIIVRRNKIHSGYAERLTQRKPHVGTYGLFVRASQRVQVEYNQIFWNSRNLVFYLTEDCRADHNTSIDTVYSGLAIWGTFPGLTLTNNLIVHNGNAQSSMSVAPDGLTSDHNCFRKADRSKCMFEVSRVRNGRAGWQTLDEWQKDYGLEKHSISADPLFVDEKNGDLRLKAGSPCIGKGQEETNIGAL